MKRPTDRELIELLHTAGSINRDYLRTLDPKRAAQGDNDYLARFAAAITGLEAGLVPSTPFAVKVERACAEFVSPTPWESISNPRLREQHRRRAAAAWRAAGVEG